MSDPLDFTQLAQDIKTWGKNLGFGQVGITDIDLSEHHEHLKAWLAKGYHGSMAYMGEHGDKRGRPDQLVTGTQRIISVRIDYLPASTDIIGALQNKERAYISRYALGRDYHKLVRKRLQKLADKITARVGAFGYRAFADSAPVLERAIANKSGLGWIGKHTNLINKKGGSWFFLGELFTDLPLPIDAPATAHCGSCRACLDVCPTQAIVAPYQVDARRCISYLTIENKGPIPKAFRKAIGNRIYGCDDCQLVCPWNKFARPTGEADFAPRHGLDKADLVTLFCWDEATFLEKTTGSAIRGRLGHVAWLRNIAVALGNGPYSEESLNALKLRANHPSELVREHVAWAVGELEEKAP